MLSKWFPWRWIVRRAARRHGFLDPFTFAARLRRFSQPSEVQEPIELIRAGAVFHARGLINTRAIQHNLDWIWPHWVHRQFNPADPGFIPRAFSFSHVNLTHRNWTAVGLPDDDHYAVIDPRGLVTPAHDAWSIDAWLVADDGAALFPSKVDAVDQRTTAEGNLAVETSVAGDRGSLRERAEMIRAEGRPRTRIAFEAAGPPGAHLVIALRPYNPEGVQFIDGIRAQDGEVVVRSVATHRVAPSAPPDAVRLSNYAQGDVANHIGRPGFSESVDCTVGMATGALCYRLGEDGERAVRVDVIPGAAARETARKPAPDAPSAEAAWARWTQACAALETPPGAFKRLYDNAARTLVLLSARDVVPGPYTYKRFWFRDACLMLNALLALGLKDRARAQIDRFGARQKSDGYYHSQEGEWDSNGQVLWIMDRFQRVTGRDLPDRWLDAMERAAHWVVRKRKSGARPAGAEGLLPAGFSAEHLGPNDFYYWDNFWALAGLRCAARQLGRAGRSKAAERARREAEAYAEAVWASVEAATARRGAIPAAPDRRMDAGAIGSMVADYPLQITPANDERIHGTLNYLMNACFYRGGFFQDMIHSGINAYLTLDLAQTLLRNGDPRWRRLVDAIAELASSTGNWPEAIHPVTSGGCMGDGQHGWAAAEWIMMARSLFAREESEGLVLASGLFDEWTVAGQRLRFGPTPTPWGAADINADVREDGMHVWLEGGLERPPPWIEARPPGFEAAGVPADGGAVWLPRVSP